MKNNKGFTLVELLVAIAILGIITSMSIPLIRNIRQNNEQRKYNSYGDSLVQATKLFIDSYGQDLFGHKKTGCALVSYQQLKDKGLIKDFSDNNMSCNSDDTLVRVVKMNKQYGYSYQLYCGPAGADGKATSAEFRSSSTSKKVNEVIKKQNDDTDKDEDNDGFSDAACNLITSMDIQINPERNTTKAESHSPKVTLMSSTGINPGSSVQYAWVDVDSKDTIPEIDYNAITDWKTANFTVDSQDSQMQKILSATDSIVLSKPKTIQTPSIAPAYYVLVLKIDNFRDLEGESWKNKDDETNPYKIAGIYNVGKKFTITYDNNGGNGCTSSSVLKEKNTNTKWGDNNSLCTPTRDKYVFTGWNTSQDGTGTTITNDTIVDSDLTVYAQWKQSKVHFRIKLQEGETITATTTADDGTVYKWAKDSNNYLTRSRNNGAAAIYDYSVNRGENIDVNLPDYNNNKYINITKTGHYTDPGKEWICESGCKTEGQTFSHNKITIADTDDICDSSSHDCTVTLKVNWKVNVCTITFSPNGGTFGSNANNTVKTLDYGRSISDFWNANGGTFKATREGHSIPKSKAWILSDGTKTFDETKGYKATDICPNLATKSESVTLKVNWNVNVCTITFSPNGGTFGSNADNTVQKMNYGSEKSDFWNANGGTFKATRTGYSITKSKAWILSDGTKTFDETKGYKATDICPNLATKSESVTLKVNWNVNVCTITFSPNGGTFGSNADNTVQKMNYGSEKSDFWNANGGTFKATREGYSITDSEAWILSGGTKLFDETKGYEATDICPNLAEKSESVTLKVNWKSRTACGKKYSPQNNNFMNLRYAPHWGKKNGNWCGQGHDGTTETCSYSAYYVKTASQNTNNAWKVQVLCDLADYDEQSGIKITHKTASSVICYRSKENDGVKEKRASGWIYNTFVRVKIKIYDKSSNKWNPNIYKYTSVLSQSTRITKLSDITHANDLEKETKSNGDIYAIFYMSDSFLNNVNC